MKRRHPLASILLACLLCFPCLSTGVAAQTNPALKQAVNELIESYLKTGPSKQELGNGAALANWALLKGVGLPRYRKDESLDKGNWNQLFQPLRKTLTDSGFDNLRPMQALTMWQETESEPARFIRLLGRQKLLDPKVPKQRNRGRELRQAIGSARSKMSPVRSTSRFEQSGWDYTGSAFLDPSSRIVRVAISGSQPCKTTGSSRTVNLSLKGRLFEDLDSPKGIKIQVLDPVFKSTGCELKLRDRLDSIERLAGGGEAKLAGNLSLDVRDDTVSGRFQVDLVSKQAGVALLTGRAVYTLRGSVSKEGILDVVLTSVSSSGSRVIRKQLEQNGTLTGTLQNSFGKGKIVLPVFKDPLEWQDSQTKTTRGRKKSKR